MEDNKNITPNNDTSNDSSPGVVDVKASSSDTTPTSPPDMPVSDSDAAKVNDTLTAPPEVKVDMEGNLSGVSAADNAKAELRQPTPADLKTDGSTDNPVAAPPQMEKKKNGRLVVIVAVVIFVLLAAAAYLAYNNNKKTKTTKTSTVATTPAKASDVDQANKDIDKDLNSVSDNSDFASTDLSDTSLGL